MKHNAIYRVEILPAARKQIKALPRETASRIIRLLELLAVNPRPTGVVKMSGLRDTYCARVGDYRIIYSIKDNKLIVLVLRVAHRRDAYR